MLWWWGNELTRVTVHGATVSVGGTPSKITAAITTPVALLLFVVGYLIYFGLPSYYRQTAGNIPSFYHSIFRRKIVLVCIVPTSFSDLFAQTNPLRQWFLVMIVLQNYWFSAQYGRNWSYLWSSAHVPRWAIAILVVVYFIIVWSAMLWILGWQSTKHSWVMPIFAISLGAPRWCQMFWGVSGIALYVPWGSRITGALLGRSLWLWLGVLDAVQGVGFGMMLLQTLSRFHVIFTLIAGQVVGSAATILARATAPNKTGPGAVFPNFALGLDGLSNAWFWLCVLSQLLIVLGFTKYFRKEQMFKP
jgi:alpha-1,3-glucan synthase